MKDMISIMNDIKKLFNYLMRLQYELRWWWLLLLFSAIAVVTALIYNIASFAYDAAAVHVLRAVIYSHAVSDGVLLPRWVQFLHWGLGSPLFTFQGPLPYALLDILYRIGIEHPFGWRLLMASGLLAAFVGAFVLALELTGGRWPAFLAAVTFLYAPYVLRNALERGSNEAYGMFLYPWVLWALFRLAKQPEVGRFIFAVLIWSIEITTHVLAPIMLTPFVFMLSIALSWRWRTITPILALLTGVLLTAFIWLPMVHEQAFVHIERNFYTPEGNPITGSLPLDRLLALPAIYDTMRDANQTGVRMGLLHAVLLVLGLPGILIAWHQKRRPLALALIATAGTGLFLTWLLTRASDPLWQALEPLLYRLQYRTRLMGLQALFIAITAGLLISLLSSRSQKRVALTLGMMLVATSVPSLYVELQLRYVAFDDRVTLADVRAVEIASGGRALTAFNEFQPRWNILPFDDELLTELGPDFDPQKRPLVNPPVSLQIQSVRVSNHAWELRLRATQPTTATLYMHYYPRWQAKLNGKPWPLSYQPGRGLVQIQIPAGDHHLLLWYGSTIAEQAGLLVSGVTALALMVSGLWAVWRRDLMSSATGFGGAKPDMLRRVEESAPPLWLLALLTALLVFKFAFIDQHTTWFRCTSTLERVCGAQATVNVPLAGGPVLRGYTVSSYNLRPGDELRVTLYWQGVMEPLPRLYSFLHVRNMHPDDPLNPRTGDGIWAQQENYAPGGRLTDQYQPGKLYSDEFRVRLPEDIPPGEYFLEVGFFDPKTLEQLDPIPESVKPPLGILWRSILLPNLTVRSD
jgi:hypothetical protein